MFIEPVTGSLSDSIFIYKVELHHSSGLHIGFQLGKSSSLRLTRVHLIKRPVSFIFSSESVGLDFIFCLCFDLLSPYLYKFLSFHAFFSAVGNSKVSIYSLIQQSIGESSVSSDLSLAFSNSHYLCRFLALPRIVFSPCSSSINTTYIIKSLYITEEEDLTPRGWPIKTIEANQANIFAGEASRRRNTVVLLLFISSATTTKVVSSASTATSSSPIPPTLPVFFVRFLSISFIQACVTKSLYITESGTLFLQFGIVVCRTSC